MPGYSYATLAQAQADVAQRLYESLSDSTREFWTDVEITAYICEALRTWNAFTSFQRSEFTFNLTQGQWWYDIPSRVGSLRPYTLTDNSLLQVIEYHLLEPTTASYPLSWTGSSQFSLQDILDNITQAQNQVLGTSGCTVVNSAVTAPIIKQRIFLPDSVIDIRRVAWVPQSVLPVWDATPPFHWDDPNLMWDTPTTYPFSVTPLRNTDMWEKRAFDPGWTVAGQRAPRTWIQSTEPPVSFDVDRTPPVPGSYDLLTVNGGAKFSTASAQSLVVPDDWSWLIKWNAMENLLGREGIAKDALRQAYCQQRYDHGIKALAMAPAVLALQLNGVPMPVDAVRNGDDFNPGWQAKIGGTPRSCYTAGMNLIGFPLTDAGPYSALLSVVQNAPVPVNPGDFIQIGKDDYSTMLDYAQHLAAFKMGGSAFANTLPLFQGFMKRASIYNSKLLQLGQFVLPQYEISQLDEERNPRLAQGAL